MTHLLDTSILLRLANQLDPAYPAADRATTRLRARGDELAVTPQNLLTGR